MKNSKLVKSQVQQHIVEGFRIDGGHGKLVIKIRYDDQCGNGNNSFAITADMYRDGREWSCGCLHDDIEAFAPEFAHLIKWHLMSSNEPIHYISNTLYHSRETDCDGLKAGEYKAYKTHVLTSALTGSEHNIFKTGEIYNSRNPNLVKSNDKESALLKAFTDSLKVPFELKQVNSEWSKSEGNPSDLQAARRSAIWLDGTLEQLQDKKALEARLPSLIEEFQAVLKTLGMEY